MARGSCELGGGVALAVPNDPSGFWSKTLGLGFTEPVTAGLLERVIEFYRDCGMSAATLQLAPSVLPVDWADIRAKLNISVSGSAWVKLAGDLGTVTAASRAAARLDDGLRVAPVPAARAREWAELTLRVFGFPVEHQVEMGAGCVGRPGWQAFAVLDGDEMIATAGLFITRSARPPVRRGDAARCPPPGRPVGADRRAGRRGAGGGMLVAGRGNLRRGARAA